MMGLMEPLHPKFLIFYAYLLSVLYVHFRGRVRHPLYRDFTDYCNLFAPYNALVYFFSAVPNKPLVDIAYFPELGKVTDNWETIRDEAWTLYKAGKIRPSPRYDDAGFNSFFKNGWGRFYLRWYRDFLPSARSECPKTVEILAGVPIVRGAMFALLPPGAKLGLHRDPYAGSLRYHLGLITPNSEQCRIHIDDQAYHWRDGEAVVFDETYLHQAVNDTDQDRIILFCDVERPLKTPVARAINRMMAWAVVGAAASRNVATEPVGWINRVFDRVYRFRLGIKRIKRWNRKLYYALKTVALLGIVYLIFFF